MTKEQRIIMVIDGVFGEESKGESVNIVRNALEKQVPKEPTLKQLYGNVVWFCPVCGADLIDFAPYCNDCGQAIDWSEDET